MSAFHKLWKFLRTRVLTIPRFDLCLQGALLIVILLEHNAYLLLNRDADTGYVTPMIEDWVIMGSGGAEFLFGAILAWWGKGKRNFALSGWLAATAVSGLIVLAFPFNRENLPSVDLCGGGQIIPLSRQEVPDPLVTPRTVFIIITAVMCALTQISIWAHGLTYLDDHEPQSGPYFYGILISIRLSLGLSGQNWLRPGAVREDWWEAQLAISMLTLMFAVIFSIFPSRIKTETSFALVEEDSDDDGFFASLGRVVTNKTLILQVGALGFMNVGLFSFFYYDRQYIQARYHIEALREDLRSARLVASIFRPLVIIFFVLIFRVRFSVRRSDGVKANTAARVGGIVAVFVAIFFAVVAVLDCGVGDVAGMESGEFEHPQCSSQCSCNSQRYGFAPVCELNTTTTYFSPCHAGCSQYVDLNGFLVFNNCSCSEGLTVRGACALPDCRLVYSLYQVILTVILAIAGASLLMQGMVFLRAVQRRDKALALGLMLGVVALLTHCFGHLLYMLISHLTCAFSDEGKCLFHRPTLYSMAVVSSGLSILSAAVSVLASKAASRVDSRADENGVNFR